MTRSYEALARLSAAAGVLALVVGLAAVPQANGATTPPVDGAGCSGGCDTQPNVATNSCALYFSFCSADCTHCRYEAVYVGGVLTSCNNESCIKQ